MLVRLAWSRPGCFHVVMVWHAGFRTQVTCGCDGSLRYKGVPQFAYVTRIDGVGARAFALPGIGGVSVRQPMRFEGSLRSSL
jgi:hypothetical protein